MKTRLPVLIIFFCAAVLLSACVTKKKLTYLQYLSEAERHEPASADQNQFLTPPTYRILPFDNLFIRVMTPDPQWAELFNAGSTGQGGILTQESAVLLGYPVDANGSIEIPYVGKQKVEGKTLSEIKTELDSVFKKYVKDASISVRLVNNYISVLGEVSRPGRYALTKYCVTVFEALAEAGDIREYGNRQRVQIIRPTKYGKVVKEFSLQDRSILTSEYYYLMPNDVVYVKPLQGRAFSINSASYSLFMTTVTTILVIITYFRALNN